MKRIVLDFETRSMADLKKQGAYKYSLHPTTRPTCLAFKTYISDVTLLPFQKINKKWGHHDVKFQNFWQNLINQKYLFVAHNAFFETCIYKNILVKRYGWPDIPFDQFRCTAAKAAACALPRSLEGAGEALNLSTQKDKMGFVAMLKTCKPTKQWNTWFNARADVTNGKKIGTKKQALANSPEPKVFLDPNDAPNVWEDLYHYCKIDVATEVLLDKSLPDLTPQEQEVWFLNQKLNWRGIKIDTVAAREIVQIMSFENKLNLKELDTLTMGLVTKAGARQSIFDFLALEGIKLPDLKAKTVEDVLKSGKLNGDMKKLLEIRKVLSKTSTKKYQSMLDRVNDDNRIRDILLYHGASTGRDSGTGVQFQNLPRNLISQKDIDYVVSLLGKENSEKQNIPLSEWLKFLYGENLSIIFSSLLRSMIIPSNGRELFVADFSKIEVAVLWWLADNKPGLDILRLGKDPYKAQAAANTGKKYEDIADDSDDRQLGKAQILGCGFRMSWKRFKETAYDMYRLKLTGKQAFEAVKKYRETHKSVPELWDKYENAAVTAVETGKKVRVGKCVFSCSKGFLWIELPSGRKLAYKSPAIVWRQITYTALEDDEKGREIEVEKTSKPKKTVQFLGLDLSKKKMRIEYTHGGILTENCVQATARDLMMHSLLNLEKSGYKILLPVHDEAITEAPIGAGDLKEFQSIMCRRPKWADKNLPLDAKAWRGFRYKK